MGANLLTPVAIGGVGGLKASCVAPRGLSAREAPEEPCPRRLPVAHRRGERGAQHESGLFQREPTEEPQFGNAGLTLVERGELLERVMEIEDVNVALGASSNVVSKGHASPAPGPLCHLVGARPIHEDAPHHLGRHREELRAVPPDRAILIHQAKVDLVHKGCRLQRLTRAFTAEERRRTPSKLLVQGRH